MLEEVLVHLFVQHEVQSVYAFSLCLHYNPFVQKSHVTKDINRKTVRPTEVGHFFFPVQIEVGQ